MLRFFRQIPFLRDIKKACIWQARFILLADLHFPIY